MLINIYYPIIEQKKITQSIVLSSLIKVFFFIFYNYPKDFFQINRIYIKIVQFWIDYTDIGMEGKWVSLFSGKSDYAIWLKGQPDNANNLEHCAYMHNAGGWNDQRCLIFKCHAMCEASGKSDPYNIYIYINQNKNREKTHFLLTISKNPMFRRNGRLSYFSLLIFSKEEFTYYSSFLFYTLPFHSIIGFVMSVFPYSLLVIIIFFQLKS